MNSGSVSRRRIPTSPEAREPETAGWSKIVHVLKQRPDGTLTLRAARDVDISASEIATMLRDAGAPQPWYDKDADKKFADEITFRWPEPVKHARSAQDLAESAIRALQTELPTLIAEKEAAIKILETKLPAAFSLAAPTMLAHHRHELSELLRLRDALPRRRSSTRLPLPWHCDAWRVFTLYQGLIDPKSGISAEGPAVRLIAAMLNAMGYGTREPAAIAKALVGWRRKIDREKSRMRKS